MCGFKSHPRQPIFFSGELCCVALPFCCVVVVLLLPLEAIVHVYVLVYTCKCQCLTPTVEPPNNGHFGDKHFVHCSEVVPFLEVLFYNVMKVFYMLI